MKASLAIQTIQNIKEVAAEKKLYTLFLRLKDINTELSKSYKVDDEVDVKHFTDLFQRCIDGLPESQRILLTPIIRELKLSQLL